MGENMNAKNVVILSFFLVALLTVSSPSLKASAEVNSLPNGITTMDSPKFDGTNVVGLPYDATSDVGENKNFKYDLEKDREYVVFVYGAFIATNTDYDIEVYEPGKSEALIVSTRAAGMLEKITFKAGEDGEYKIRVRNDKDDSGGDEGAKIFLAEVAKLGNSYEVLIEHQETIHTYYAFWFDASGYTGSEITVKLKTSKDVDMYQMRLYPFVSGEESGEGEQFYDILESTSEHALLTADAGQAGEDLEFSFIAQASYEGESLGVSSTLSDTVNAQQDGNEFESPDGVFIISLIGEKGDGECKFTISAESEDKEETQPTNETTTEEPTVRPLCLGTLAVSAFTVISLIAIGIKRRRYGEET
ncbi:hypothetical protein [Candidatus Borrarchaeum sp.]|uniref:hypothetical protein n=1 Tax=Candidatus Borrarchaeum sp. TaxID=2846742 RepID=UPI0025804D49|nr:hypothetical protein [Candidatus Borrarchaeum sp.]